MKTIKKEQNLIIINFILNIAIFILFIGFFIFYTYPLFLEVETKKSEVSNIINILNRIKKEGMNFSEFSLERKDHSSSINDVYLKKIVLKINKNFFEENLTNNWSSNYLDFIENLKSKLRSSNVHEQQRIIDDILPIYNDKIGLEEDYNLTDFKFINYLEKILYTFSLTYNNKIWIRELIPVNSSTDLKDTKNENDLNSTIFYIPVRLNISWDKSDILNFLHYFEQVGSINTDAWEIIVHNDNFIKKRGRPVSLEWQEYNIWEGYNIYYNQLGDIEYVKFRDYIDSSSEDFREDNETFIEFINKTQGGWKLDMEVGLRFYVRWLPDYKVKEYIENFIKSYNELKKDIDSELKNKDTFTVRYLQNIKSLYSYLSSIEKKVKEISKNLDNSKELNSIYEKVIKYDKIIKNIKSFTLKSKEKLNKQ